MQHFIWKNDSLYNISNIAFISDGSEYLNVVELSLENNAILVTPQQLESLGIQLENNIVTSTPVFEVNKNIVLSENSVLKPREPETVLANTYHSTESEFNQNVLNFVSAKVPQVSLLKNSKIQKKKQSVIKEATVKPVDTPNKIVYRVLHPEELRLTESKNVTKKETVPVDKISQCEPKVIKPKGRPIKPKEILPKESVVVKVDKKDEYKDEADVEEEVLTVKAVRTRFGRMTKPPQHLKEEKDHPTESEKSGDAEPAKKQMRMTFPSDQNITSLNALTSEKVSLLRNSSLLSSAVNGTLAQSVKPSQSIPEQKIQKRKITSSKFLCKTCNRYYLGRVRMKRHLQLNPDHVSKKYESNNQLWLDMIERTMDVPKVKQSTMFIGELSNILQKIRTVVPKILKPALESDANSCEVDRCLSSMLGIAEGKYVLDIELLEKESTSPTEAPNNVHMNPVNTIVNGHDLLQNVIDPTDKTVTDILEDTSISIQNGNNSNDSENSAQTCLLNLLDTGQVNFDSDLAHSSEAVRCVDQLVNERLKTLTGVELPSHPNPVQNLTLDLSMDMFSYTS